MLLLLQLAEYCSNSVPGLALCYFQAAIDIAEVRGRWQSGASPSEWLYIAYVTKVESITWRRSYGSAGWFQAKKSSPRGAGWLAKGCCVETWLWCRFRGFCFETLLEISAWRFLGISDQAKGRAVRFCFRAEGGKRTRCHAIRPWQSRPWASCNRSANSSIPPNITMHGMPNLCCFSALCMQAHLYAISELFLQTTRVYYFMFCSWYCREAYPYLLILR